MRGAIRAEVYSVATAVKFPIAFDGVEGARVYSWIQFDGAYVQQLLLLIYAGNIEPVKLPSPFGYIPPHPV